MKFDVRSVKNSKICFEMLQYHMKIEELVKFDHCNQRHFEDIWKKNQCRLSPLKCSNSLGWFCSNLFTIRRFRLSVTFRTPCISNNIWNRRILLLYSFVLRYTHFEIDKGKCLHFHKIHNNFFYSRTKIIRYQLKWTIGFCDTQ